MRPGSVFRRACFIFAFLGSGKNETCDGKVYIMRLVLSKEEYAAIAARPTKWMLCDAGERMREGVTRALGAHGAAEKWRVTSEGIDVESIESEGLRHHGISVYGDSGYTALCAPYVDNGGVIAKLKEDDRRRMVEYEGKFASKLAERLLTVEKDFELSCPQTVVVYPSTKLGRKFGFSAAMHGKLRAEINDNESLPLTMETGATVTIDISQDSATSRTLSSSSSSSSSISKNPLTHEVEVPRLRQPRLPFSLVHSADISQGTQGMAEIEGTGAPNVFRFSPIGAELMGYAALKYLSAGDASATKDSMVSPYESGDYERVLERMQRVIYMDSREDASGGEVPVVKYAAGTVLDKKRLQDVLLPGPLDIPDVNCEYLITVSRVDYAYEWPRAIRAAWNNPTLFKLNGESAVSDKNVLTMLAECYTSSAQHDNPDTLVVRVEKADKYEVHVVFIMVPDVIPDSLAVTKPEDLRCGMFKVHSQFVEKCASGKRRSPVRLGCATLYKFGSALDAFSLDEVKKSGILNGVHVEIAQQACSMSMNETGGSIVAVSMAAMYMAGPPGAQGKKVDMPFHLAKNGYLVYIERVEAGPDPDFNPGLIGAAWVNRPAT